MKISIVIPMYNAEAYIERCIRSVKEQKFQEYEVIVVDDGSRDASYEVCRKAIGDDCRYRMLRQENSGVSAARNKGIEEASGDWLYFLDSDDELTANALEHMAKLADCNLQWVCTGLKLMDEKTGQIRENPRFFEEEVYHANREDLPELLNHQIFMYPVAKLYRRDLIQQYQIRFPLHIQYGEDIRFNMEYFQYVKTYDISRENTYIYHIRQGEGLGSKYYENNYALQMELTEKLQYMTEQVYGLSKDALKRMNLYYLRQGINTAAAYLNVWRELPFGKRCREIGNVMKDQRFQRFVYREYEYGRMNRIDFVLLRGKHFFFYYWLHYLYAGLKKLAKK